MAALTLLTSAIGVLMNLHKEVIEGKTWYTATVGRESFSTQRDNEDEARERLTEIITRAGLDPQSVS